ncbi:MAG: hypothetical protein M1814_005210 [Vezdaea aestivalis]|nr:MAG: hypothetical protein M1814_005210 [Vezdaea aestivalis]
MRREASGSAHLEAAPVKGRDLPKLKMTRRTPRAEFDPRDRAEKQIENVRRRLRAERRVRPRQAGFTGRVNNVNDDYSYTVSLSLGTPLQTVELVVDTGAQWTWVTGINCNTESCNGRQKYNPGLSSTSSDVNGAFSASYGFGSVGGTYATDNILFAGFNVKSTFGIASTLSSEFTGVALDGLLGLGDSSLSRDYARNDPSVLDALYNSKQITQRIFGIRLSRTADGKDDGEITFGGYDPSAFTGPVNWNPTVKTSNYWSIQLSSSSVNDGRSSSTSKTAIIDSGLSIMVLPVDDANTLMSQFPGYTTSTNQAGGVEYYLPCNTKGSINLTFGSVTYAITEKDFLATQYRNEAGLCYVNLNGKTMSGDWYIGDPFMRNVYTIYDVENSRIGFGRK